MSFLLDTKPRRRDKIPNRSIGPVRNRNLLQRKDLSNSFGGGGQIQIQRPLQHQQQRLQQKQRIIPQQQQRDTTTVSMQQQQQQQHHNQRSQQAMQTAGISMEQVMEDLRVLEEQQRDSQRKLAQAKVLKQSRLQRQTTIENKLAALKYSNGEQRAQLNRARDILSKSTSEYESLKLDARANDDRLKACDTKLKKALALTRMFQSYLRKVDGRLQYIRSKESACQRLESVMREDVKVAEKNFKNAQAKEQQLRQSISQSNNQAQSISDECSKVRSEIAGLAEDLRTSKQMQSSTQARAASITEEIAVTNAQHQDKMKAVETQLADIRAKKQSLLNNRQSLIAAIPKKEIELKKLWAQFNSVQVQLGHKPTPLPETFDGANPQLDMGQVQQYLQEQEAKLTTTTTERDTLLAKKEMQEKELSKLQGETIDLETKAKELRQVCEKEHQVELERTTRHEAFLATVEKERQEVELLKASLAELETNTVNEQKRLQAKISATKATITAKTEDTAVCSNRLTEINNAVEVATKGHLIEKETATAKLKQAKAEADQAKAEFEKVKLEAESLRDNEDPKLKRELEEIEQAQNIMVETTEAKVESLSKANPALQDILDNFQYNPSTGRQEQVEAALVTYRRDCKERLLAIKAERKQIVTEIRQEKKDLAEKQRMEQDALEEAEREKKVRRREEKRRKKAELEAAKEQKRQELQEQADLEAAAEKKRRKKAELEAAKAKKRQELQEQAVLEAAAEKKRLDRERKRATQERKEADRIAVENVIEADDAEPPFATVVEDTNKGINWGTPNEIERCNAEDGFVDTGFGGDDDSLNGADGCLTQRVGLTVPSPRSPNSALSRTPPQPALVDQFLDGDEPRNTTVRWDKSPQRKQKTGMKESKKQVYGSSASRSSHNSVSSKSSKGKERRQSLSKSSRGDGPKASKIQSGLPKTKLSKSSDLSLQSKTSLSAAKKYKSNSSSITQKTTTSSKSAATSKRPSGLTKPSVKSASKRSESSSARAEKTVSKKAKNDSRSVVSSRSTGTEKSKKSTLSKRSVGSKHRLSSLEKYTDAASTGGASKRRRKSKGAEGKTKKSGGGLSMAPDFAFNF